MGLQENPFSMDGFSPKVRAIEAEAAGSIEPVRERGTVFSCLGHAVASPGVNRVRIRPATSDSITFTRICNASYTESLELGA